MPAGTLIIRADASVVMGTGHVMRCIALAQAWQDYAGKNQAGQGQGRECVFATAETTPASEARVRGEKFEVATVAAAPGSAEDAAQLVELALARGAGWVVLDGYQFDVGYQRQVKAAGLKLLVVDDTAHVGSYVADLVLDQNAHATEDLYQRRETHTGLLLGPRYALLRREFKSWRKWKREIAPSARQVLVTVGGADPDNLTARVIRGLRMLTDDKPTENKLQATVVVGGSNPHGGSLEAEVRGSGGAIGLLRNVSNMPELMARADVAVSGAGTTCWEICFLGLPVLLIDIAENQTPLAWELQHQGIAIHVGNVRDVTPQIIAAQVKAILDSRERRAEMSRRGRELVDGQGADRVVSVMHAANLSVREVEESDCQLLWEWANEAEVRSASFFSAPIPWEEHQTWFTKKLRDEKTLMLIACDEYGVPVGQVRFERTNSGEADIDVSIAAERRGSGLGARLIERAVQTAFERNDLARLHAFVKPGNRASAKAFERAGFRNVGETQVRGNAAIHFQRARDGGAK